MMKFSYKKKKYIWKPTKWQKDLAVFIFAGAVGLIFTILFYKGWIYEQTVTHGRPWLGGG